MNDTARVALARCLEDEVALMMMPGMNPGVWG
jgi:hypothetical protein